MDNPNKILDQLFEEKDASSFSLQREKENEILEPLLMEIDLIFDESIKNFVRSLLLKANCFWTIPASFSGEYHPPDERDEGGNVLHTKRVVRAAYLIADSYTLEAEERDILMAAALLHDVTKGVVWRPDEFPTYDPFHPYTLDRFVRMVQLEDNQFKVEHQSSTLYLDDDIVQAILRLVRCHMGIWSPIPETYPTYALEMILHLADNIAAHLHLILDGEEADSTPWRWQKPEQE